MEFCVVLLRRCVAACELDYHISVLDGGSDFSFHHSSSIGIATGYGLDGR
jgi:hypothetical protein